MYNLRNENYLTLLDYSTEGMSYLLQLAETLKQAKYAGTEQPKLQKKKYSTYF